MGGEADDATRTLTTAWARAWGELRGQFAAALADVVDLALTLEHWPQPWQLARVNRLAAALSAADESLRTLATRTGVVVTDAAGNAITATGEAEPRLISSQLPAADRAAATEVLSGRVLPGALEAIVARTTGQINATSRPLSAEASEAMKRTLIRGVALGQNPNQTARDMVARVEGDFNGGLTRAMNIARTETLDAYRAASRYAQIQNADFLQGWRWQSSLDRRTCPSCWSKHGTLYALSNPGPLDHQQGRCARMPVAKPWSDLGLGDNEPPSTFPDAHARFAALPEADQLAIMGPGRLALLTSGQITFADLSVPRPSLEWRTSYGPRPVAALQNIAAQRAAQTAGTEIFL